MKKIIVAMSLMCGATVAGAAEYEAQARVIRSEPIYTAGQQRCWNETVSTGGGGGDNLGGQIVGGVVGGLLGNQIGGGNGRSVATAGGAIAGTIVGGRVANGNGGTRTVQRCTEGAREINGYNVAFEYNGERRTARMSRAPGEYITVRVRTEVYAVDR